MRVVPQPVRPADLDVDEPREGCSHSWIRVSQRTGRRGSAARTPGTCRRPSPRRAGVDSRKRSSGGVIASRFRGSAKNGNTASGGASSRCSKRITWTSGPLIATEVVRTLHADDRPAQRRCPGPARRRPRPRPGRRPRGLSTATSRARVRGRLPRASSPRASGSCSATSRSRRSTRVRSPSPTPPKRPRRRGVLAADGGAVRRPGPPRRPAPVGPLRTARHRPRPLRGATAGPRGGRARPARRPRSAAGRCDRDADRRTIGTGEARNCFSTWVKFGIEKKTNRPADRRAGQERQHI